MLASMSDFTLGDLWAYKTLVYADDVAKNGIALLVVNTIKANKIISDISSIFRKEISYNEALLSNPNLIEQTKKDSYKIGRYKKFCKRYSFNVSIDKTLVFPLWKRIINKIKILCIK